MKKDRKLTDQIIYEDSIQNEKIKDQFLELIKIMLLIMTESLFLRNRI